MHKKEVIVELNCVDAEDTLICSLPKDLFPPIPTKGELIRCKDCEHREERLYLGGTTVFCLIYERYMGIMEYCSKAERKKEC